MHQNSEPLAPVPEEPSFQLPRSLFQAMVAHAQAERPLEACGLVGGIKRRATRFFPTENEAASPVYYIVPAKIILQTLRVLDRDGEELVAIFHSHPTTAAYPSKTDIKLAFYPESVYLILSLAEETPALHGYHIRDGQVSDVRVQIIENS